jgi:hypothetical protein
LLELPISIGVRIHMKSDWINLQQSYLEVIQLLDSPLTTGTTRIWLESVKQDLEKSLDDAKTDDAAA